jgi:hypothetical protein
VKSTLRHSWPVLLPTLVYVALAVGLFCVVAISVGFALGAEIGFSLIIGGLLPGTALVRRLFGRPSAMHYLVVGAIIGLGLLALGGMLSHLTGLFWIRWVPSVLGLAVWAVPHRETVPLRATSTRFPPLAIWGSIAATAAMLPALKTALSSQPTQWTGWYRFYADLPFDIALTSEVAARSPQVYPWVANTPLSYPWLYHSAMGVWASMTAVPPADFVLQAWPVLFAILIPAAISITAWEITRNNYVASAAPLIFVAAHGVVVTPEILLQAPLFQISPTRDFADLFILFTALSLIRLLRARSFRSSSVWWFIALGLSAFVATGAKGSAMPILVGGVLASTFILLVSRRLTRSSLVTVAVFAAAAATSFVAVLPEPGSAGSLAWGPLSFLPPQTPDRIATSLLLLALLVIAIVGSGILLAGVLGLGLLTHPGGSQLYFWENAQPILAIALAWAGVVGVRVYGIRFVVAAVVVFLSSKAVNRLGLGLVVHGATIVVTAALTILVLQLLRRWRPQSLGGWRPRILRRWLLRAEPTRRTRFATVVISLAFIAVVTQAAQSVSVPVGVLGGAVSKASNSGAIDKSQLAAYKFIEDHSAPNDRVITTKHCLAGTGDHCDSRWFAIAAFSERRVLVEGWAYTQHGASPSWIRKDLELSETFVSSPTVAEKHTLISLDVRYVYVDKRDAYSTRGLAKIADLVFSSKWAAVYDLK